MADKEHTDKAPQWALDPHARMIYPDTSVKARSPHCGAFG